MYLSCDIVYRNVRHSAELVGAQLVAGNLIVQQGLDVRAVSLGYSVEAVEPVRNVLLRYGAELSADSELLSEALREVDLAATQANGMFECVFRRHKEGFL